MAKYIKFNLTDGEDLSIDINDIESVSYINANTTQIDLNNGISKFTITHGSALQATAVVEAVYAAMMAPTIGVYSVVKGPVSVAQIVDSSSGRQLITTKEKNVTFTSYVFETVPAIEERFIISVKTDNSGASANNQFTLPWIGTYDVDWGDGNTDTGVVDTQTHTYASAGTYDVAVTATTGRIYFNNTGDKSKLLDIKNWGTCTWTTMERAFMRCDNLTNVSAIDTPDFSIMNSLKFSFYICSNLISMDVSSWDVSNVVKFETGFQSCINLETLNGIENWNFQSLGIDGLKNTFYNCKKFNSNVGNWTNVGPILQGVLKDCDSFDHSLANWDLSTVNFSNPTILQNATDISQTNYDATLISWSSQSLVPNKTLDMGGSQYTLGGAAEAARNTIINTYGWTIVDGGGV